MRTPAWILPTLFFRIAFDLVILFCPSDFFNLFCSMFIYYDVVFGNIFAWSEESKFEQKIDWSWLWSEFIASKLLKLDMLLSETSSWLSFEFRVLISSIWSSSMPFYSKLLLIALVLEFIFWSTEAVLEKSKDCILTGSF